MSACWKKTASAFFLEMASNHENNKRIAKNTLFLYFRTMLVMAISLYTSRIILSALGVEDYGVYNVVGGAVAMFGVVSGALSSAIGRFITFELGKNDFEELKRVFSTSVNIQILISIAVLLIAETIGLWFLYNKLNIPADRMNAAFWVLQFSLLSFCINLLSVPYNACIIAHEHMKAFAYVSIIEAVGKLGICYLIMVSPWDNLISYAVLVMMISVIIRFVYGIYCHRHFLESRYSFIFDKKLLKKLGSFAGWNFFTNTAYIFNTQGVNILINMFFGVTFNAARGIAVQVDNAIIQFVNNFIIAINPQITKNYAAGNMTEMNKLVCRGARFSFLLMMLFSLPFFFETDIILELWLNVVPEETALFVKLGLIGSVFTALGNTGYTACMATGNIRRYTLWITTVGCLVFPVSFIVYKLGAPVYASYIVFIIVYLVLDFVRLWIMHDLLNFPVFMFIKDVFGRIVPMAVLTIVPPLFVVSYMDQGVIRLLASCLVCTISTILFGLLVGVSKQERCMILNMVKDRIRR
jgi:O-antigen/teichoic acid export membrane protein